MWSILSRAKSNQCIFKNKKGFLSYIQILLCALVNISFMYYLKQYWNNIFMKTFSQHDFTSIHVEFLNFSRLCYNKVQK